MDRRSPLRWHRAEPALYGVYGSIQKFPDRQAHGQISMVINKPNGVMCAETWKNQQTTRKNIRSIKCDQLYISHFFSYFLNQKNNFCIFFMKITNIIRIGYILIDIMMFLLNCIQNILDFIQNIPHKRNKKMHTHENIQMFGYYKNSGSIDVK